jgi:hypothetical protein
MPAHAGIHRDLSCTQLRTASMERRLPQCCWVTACPKRRRVGPACAHGRSAWHASVPEQRHVRGTVHARLAAMAVRVVHAFSVRARDRMTAWACVMHHAPTSRTASRVRHASDAVDSGSSTDASLTASRVRSRTPDHAEKAAVRLLEVHWIGHEAAHGLTRLSARACCRDPATATAAKRGQEHIMRDRGGVSSLSCVQAGGSAGLHAGGVHVGGPRGRFTTLGFKP